ncbi:histidine phosphatase family protein [Paenibacillus tundrae]|uniref:Broad specificity phosphatase PhoE n=1 Tax=Paenibacillus tundrae TaxID=528187 RepID=A0ABT9WES5_9BACL|nr:histidine phosphatase family protein [Paenibacillus tundrae]MDQ0171772.1 broad specificity phosphatase PhoE [Paenibacillus tundrae]
MSMMIYVVRHGIKEQHMGDVGLTEKGIVQAEQTAEYFKKLPNARIFSSPLRGAMDTANYISLANGGCSKSPLLITKDALRHLNVEVGIQPKCPLLT